MSTQPAVARFPDATQIVTTAHEPFYEPPAYQASLERMGYERMNRKAFDKPVHL